MLPTEICGEAKDDGIHIWWQNPIPEGPILICESKQVIEDPIDAIEMAEALKNHFRGRGASAFINYTGFDRALLSISAEEVEELEFFRDPDFEDYLDLGGEG